MFTSQKQKGGPRTAHGLYHDVAIRVIKLLNVTLITAPFVGCWLLYYTRRILLFSSPLRSAGVISMFVLMYFMFARVYDAFLISIKRISEMFFCQALGILLADAAMFLVLWLMSGGFPNLPPALAALAGQLLLSYLWCKYAHVWYFHNFAGRKIAIVCDELPGMEKRFEQYGLSKKFDVKASCTVAECLAGSMSVLNGMETVFLCGVHSHERNIILKYCVANNICAYVVPCIGDVIMSGTQRMHLFYLPMLRVGCYNPPPEFVLVKRAFDVLASSAAILLTSPLMLGVAAAVKLQDGGKVFYRQTRLTKDGREFEILNVRCMGIAGYSAQNSCAIAA